MSSDPAQIEVGDRVVARWQNNDNRPTPPDRSHTSATGVLQEIRKDGIFEIKTDEGPVVYARSRWLSRA
jgi:hypothetical protein